MIIMIIILFILLVDLIVHIQKILSFFCTCDYMSPTINLSRYSSARYAGGHTVKDSLMFGSAASALLVCLDWMHTNTRTSQEPKNLMIILFEHIATMQDINISILICIDRCSK